MKDNHPLLRTLCSLKGNQRACVITEPLWAIPNNLILPFMSVFMTAVGLKDAQIGMVASFGLAMQFMWSLFSGAIVDKYGRRRTMLVFGLISWTLPCIFWAASRGYWYFMIAVFFNSMWRVMGNSFSCMIIEDGESGKLINIYSIIGIFGILAGFISPVIGLFIDRFAFIPTMRILYIIAMIMMTVKFVLQYRLAQESEIGKRRRDECRHKSIISMTFSGWNVFLDSFRHTKLLLYVVLMILMTCFSIVQSTFWPLFISTAYSVNASMLSVFPLVKAITTIFVYLVLTPRIHLFTIRRPLLAGLGSHLFGLTMLIACLPISSAAIGAVFVSAVCEAFAFAIINPLFESLLSVSIPENERARVNSLITAMILLISIPVGGFAGLLSQQNRVFPLVLNLCLISAEILMVLYIASGSKQAVNL